MNDDQQPRLATVSELAAERNVSVQAIYAALKKVKSQGLIVSRLVDGVTMIDVDAFLRAGRLRKRVERVQSIVGDAARGAAVPAAQAAAIVGLFAAAVEEIITALEGRAAELANAATAFGSAGAESFLTALGAEFRAEVSAVAREAASTLRRQASVSSAD